MNEIKYYKLIDDNDHTFNGTQWGENVTHTATGNGKKLCTKDCIHVYDSKYKAVIHNPIHADFVNPHLWECRVENIIADDRTKVGVKSCTTIKRVPLPRITTTQRVRLAIYCAFEVCTDQMFVKWANNWLSGEDRTGDAAWAAAKAADWAAKAADWAAKAADWAAAKDAKMDIDSLFKKAVKDERELQRRLKNDN